MRNKFIGILGLILMVIGTLLLSSCAQKATSYTQQGNSCVVTPIGDNTTYPNGATLLTCGQTSSILVNGSNNQYMVDQIIDPCGDSPGIYDEVLLKLYNGQILALFVDNVNGLNARLSLIPAGNFVTTDGSNCHFSVDGVGNVTW